MTSTPAHDYIVVGGGSAGCVAAGVLADGGASVTLIERGPSADEHPAVLRSDGYKDAFVDDGVFLERFSEPQPSAGKQRIFMGTGGVLGGSGAINGTSRSGRRAGAGTTSSRTSRRSKRACG